MLVSISKVPVNKTFKEIQEEQARELAAKEAELAKTRTRDDKKIVQGSWSGDGKAQNHWAASTPWASGSTGQPKQAVSVGFWDEPAPSPQQARKLVTSPKKQKPVQQNK